MPEQTPPPTVKLNRAQRRRAAKKPGLDVFDPNTLRRASKRKQARR